MERAFNVTKEKEIHTEETGGRYREPTGTHRMPRGSEVGEWRKVPGEPFLFLPLGIE